MKVYSVLLIIVFSLTTNTFSQIQFTPHIITTSANSVRSVYAIDVDGDTDMDVLSASFDDDKIVWYENDGNENFTNHLITNYADAAMSVYAVDVDGDGDIDVLSASLYDNKIAWYENDGNENFISHTITTGALFANSVYAIDVDSDGDIDVLSASASDDKIAWYENDGNENFTSHTITTNANIAQSVYAIDMDGDGDIDVLSASGFDNKIAWYENDGNENFTSHLITTGVIFPRSVYAKDVDSDGDIDVLSASCNDDKIVWYENDGNENFTPYTITTNAYDAQSVYAIDIDNDGDIDVLSASATDDKIAWYENDGGENFTTHIITTDAIFAKSVYAIDMDGDGNIDVLSASFGDNKIAWYENLGPIQIEISGLMNNSDFYLNGPFNQDRLHINIRLRNLQYPSEIFEDIKVDVYLDGSLMTSVLNSSEVSLDIDNDGDIDKIPSAAFPNRELVNYVAYSEQLNGNIENKEITVQISSINGQTVNYSMSSLISYAFAKNVNPFSLTIDAYSFDNPPRLTFKEFIYFILSNLYEPIWPLTAAYMYIATNGGRCFGMAATSGTYFLHPALKPLSGIVYEWDENHPIVMANIIQYHIAQALCSFSRNYDFNVSYNILKDNLTAHNPVLVGLVNEGPSNRRRHATLAINYTEFQHSGEVCLGLYDNNENTELHTAIYDKGNNTFNYRGLYDSFTTFPQQIFTMSDLSIAFNWFIGRLSELLNGNFWKSFSIACPANLMVVNSIGQRLGYDNFGNFYDEIPNSQIQRVATNNAAEDSITVIYVPNYEEYSVEMNGNEYGDLRFEYINPLNDSSIYVALKDSIEINSSSTVCFFEDSNPNFIDIDYDGDGIVDDSIETITGIIISGIQESNSNYEYPVQYKLSQNYPNPFNPTTTIKYQIPELSFVTIKVYDVLGNEIVTLVNEEKPIGSYNVEFDATGLPSGIYFYKLRAGDFVETKKMVLLK